MSTHNIYFHGEIRKKNLPDGLQVTLQFTNFYGIIFTDRIIWFTNHCTWLNQVLVLWLNELSQPKTVSIF